MPVTVIGMGTTESRDGSVCPYLLACALVAEWKFWFQTEHILPLGISSNEIQLLLIGDG